MDQSSKAKALVELNVTKDIQGNKKSFCKYANDKGKTRENMSALQEETGYLVTSVFTSKFSTHSNQAIESKGRDWEHEELRAVVEDKV